LAQAGTGKNQSKCLAFLSWEGSTKGPFPSEAGACGRGWGASR